MGLDVFLETVKYLRFEGLWSLYFVDKRFYKFLRDFAVFSKWALLREPTLDWWTQSPFVPDDVVPPTVVTHDKSRFEHSWETVNPHSSAFHIFNQPTTANAAMLGPSQCGTIAAVDNSNESEFQFANTKIGLTRRHNRGLSYSNVRSAGSRYEMCFFGAQGVTVWCAHNLQLVEEGWMLLGLGVHDAMFHTSETDLLLCTSQNNILRWDASGNRCRPCIESSAIPELIAPRLQHNSDAVFEEQRHYFSISSVPSEVVMLWDDRHTAAALTMWSLPGVTGVAWSGNTIVASTQDKTHFLDVHTLAHLQVDSVVEDPECCVHTGRYLVDMSMGAAHDLWSQTFTSFNSILNLQYPSMTAHTLPLIDRCGAFAYTHSTYSDPTLTYIAL